MGTSKLLLSIDGRPLIDRVLHAWSSSCVNEIVVIVRADDAALRRACDRWQDVRVVVPNPAPEDMTASVAFGVQWLRHNRRPCDTDFVLTGPADLPDLSASHIDRLCANAVADHVTAPIFGNRPGHPLAFAWSLASHIEELSGQQTLRDLIDRLPRHELRLPASERPGDVDTPAELQSYLQKLEEIRCRRSPEDRTED